MTKPVKSALPPIPDVAGMLAQRRPDHALEQAFYLSDEMFARDMRDVFMPEWHFAGHVTDIPEPGDFILFELLEESVILCRDETGRVHALANVCRHRGSRVCLEQGGKARRFSCPYHAWTYNLDGSLFSARMMGADFDKASNGLKPVPVEIFAGMIFVSFASEPSSFDALRGELDALMAPFGLDRTRIAHRESYPVAANWKLLVENYNECYHCAPAHPEFARTHPTHMDADRVKPFNEAMLPRANELGIPTDTVDKVGDLCPPGSVDFTFSRHSLYDGYLTGSQSGQPVAPLLGELKGYDGGACDLYVGIFNPMLVYCDHAVIYRFIPVDKDNSIQEIIWLVREDAVEGQDYDKAELTWLWDVTTIADKLIIEKNQEGVRSRYYEPGQLAGMEAYTRRFLDLYAARLSAGLDAETRP